jgi:outer membrane protein OmpA-like peptidoglycan-associated protein
MMRKIIQNLIVSLSILGILSLYGCAVAVLGIGAAGAGAFAYLNGKLTKTYESEYHDTIHASSYTLRILKIPVAEILSDELTTEIKAKRANDTPVAIEIVRIDQEHTQVSVRTGSLGIWDKKVSEQIHSYINEALKGKIAGDEKSSDDLAKENLQSTKERAVETAIIEKELTKNPKQAIHTETGTDPALRVLEEKRLRAAQMLDDSAFYIFFEQNSNELSPKAIEKLDRVYEILSDKPAAKLALNGYSDSIGAPSYNQMVSEIRAKAVKSYLSGKGIEPSRMMAFGHGAGKPIASNKSAEGRRLNRRVEIELITP